MSAKMPSFADAALPLDHRSLSLRLARHLRRQGFRCWIEAQRVGKYSYGDSPRIDVLALRPWTGRVDFEMIAFEIKVSRSDMQRDLNAGKWRSYAAKLGVPRVAIACPDGMAKLDELPADLGLFTERADGTWRRQRLGRPLEGDQRKLDPLLLLWCLSSNGDESSLRFRSAPTRDERLRLALPEDALKILESVDLANDRVTRDLIARGAQRRGAAVAARVSAVLYGERHDPKATDKWATDLIDAIALVSGKSADDLMREIRQGYRKPILDEIARVVEIAAIADRLNSALYAIATSLSAYTNGEKRDEALAKAESLLGLATATREDAAPRARARRKRVAVAS